MKIRLLSVGGKAPGWVDAGFAEYAKRLPPSLPLLLEPVPAPKHLSDPARFRRSEGEKLLARVNDETWVVALDATGRQMDSPGLARRLDAWQMQGKEVALMIGGSDGLSVEVMQRADEVLSLSLLTFPHHMVRLLIAEALYRSWSINSGHPYHRS